MTEQEVSQIEDALSVKLPREYTDIVTDYPFEEFAGKSDWSIGDNWQSLVSSTQKYRQGFGSTPPWPHELIAIGCEGDACPIVLNLESGLVLKLDHGNPTKDPMEKYENLGVYLKILLKDYEEMIKEEDSGSDEIFTALLIGLILGVIVGAPLLNAFAGWSYWLAIPIGGLLGLILLGFVAFFLDKISGNTNKNCKNS